MRKFQSRHLTLLFILIPPLLASCMCVLYFIPRSVNFLTSSSSSNYLWSLEVTRELSNNGISVHDVTVSQPPGPRVIDIQIGNTVYGKDQRTYELVKMVHKLVIKTFQNSSLKPDPADAIAITVLDNLRGSYLIGIDFETARKYVLGEISEEAYFESWSFPDNTPGIQPP